MREVQASDAKIHLPRLLSEVEHGETIVITRHGKPIARIVPEVDQRQVRVRQAMARLEEFRRTMPRLTLDEILSSRHEGHKY